MWGTGRFRYGFGRPRPRIISLMNSDETPRLLTTPEAAELLRCQPATLEKWRKERRGPDFVKVANKCLYPLEAIERWLSSRQQSVEQ